MAQIASNYPEALRNDHFVLHVDMQNKIASSNQNGMKCILFDAVLSSKPKAAQAHLATATKQWHAQHDVKLLPGWPGNSLTLNSIQSLCSQMK